MNPQKIERLEKKRAYARIGNMFGIEATGRDLEEHVRDLGKAANNVIDNLVEKRLSREKSSSRLETSFEVKTENDPVELALMMFVDEDKRIRFEAKRKLVLMKVLGSVRQRAVEAQTDEKFKDFLDILKEKMWAEKGRIGPPEFIVSFHDPDTLKCITPPRVQKDEPELEYGQMNSEINRRRFLFPGTSDKESGQRGTMEIPVYVREHDKTEGAIALKTIIKGEENPAKAVDDEAGIMVVFDNEADMERFKIRMEEVADEKESGISIEDEADSLDGQGHEQAHSASSPETPMYKFHARFSGMRVEIMCHTNETYTNYNYQRGIAHDEYDVKRLFNSGAIALLFPEDIYGHSEAELYNRAMKRVRRNLRSHINFEQGSSDHDSENIWSTVN